jgi:hypothetical protein
MCIIRRGRGGDKREVGADRGNRRPSITPPTTYNIRTVTFNISNMPRVKYRSYLLMSASSLLQCTVYIVRLPCDLRLKKICKCITGVRVSTSAGLKIQSDETQGGS